MFDTERWILSLVILMCNSSSGAGFEESKSPKTVISSKRKGVTSFWKLPITSFMLWWFLNFPPILKYDLQYGKYYLINPHIAAYSNFLQHLQKIF